MIRKKNHFSAGKVSCISDEDQDAIRQLQEQISKLTLWRWKRNNLFRDGQIVAVAKHNGSEGKGGR